MASSSAVTLEDLSGGDDSVISARAAAQDIAFGSLAGMVAEIFEYPFDLAKVRLQAQVLTPASSGITRFDGPMHCLMQTWKDEGVRGMYRGLPAPLVGAMAETASLFLAYTSFQNLIRNFSSSSSSHRNTPLSIPQLSLAAASAGFVTSFVLTPIELVKCKMQVQMMNYRPSNSQPVPGRIPRRTAPVSSIHPSASSLTGASVQHSTSRPSSHHHPGGRSAIHDYAGHKSAVLPPLAESVPKPPGSIALIRSIIDTYGVKGLWLGHTGTLLRETGGSAAWFVTKEWVARKLIERRLRSSGLDPVASHHSRSLIEPSSWESAVSGAIAGAVGALVFYPADTVKSAIQTEEELRPHSRRANAHGRFPRSTFVGTFRRMYTRHGLRGLYAGCGMTVARAVPSSCIIFVVYDGLTAWFS